LIEKDLLSLAMNVHGNYALLWKPECCQHNFCFARMMGGLAQRFAFCIAWHHPIPSNQKFSFFLLDNIPAFSVQR
jgi:hypothetical protein